MSDNATGSSGPIFIAMGGLWLDEIHAPYHAPVTDVVGGTVIFATLGARLFADNAATRKRIRMVFVAGHDFPFAAFETWRRWGIDTTTHWEPEKPAARIRIDYGSGDFSKRSWQRLTAPLTTTWRHLTLPDILQTECFHFFVTPADLAAQVESLLAVRLRHSQSYRRPLIVWEPQAKTCSPDTLDAHREAAKLVDVFSPNHVELARFFATTTHDGSLGDTRGKAEMPGVLAADPLTFAKEVVESQARHFLTTGIGPESRGCIVVRAAEHGCLVMSLKPAAHASSATESLVEERTWLSAYHQPGASSKVVDPTGAGNAFLGGFAIGYHETRSWVEAASYGTVAASFVIEQVGLPLLASESGAEHENVLSERWNGDSVRQRLDKYRARLS